MKKTVETILLVFLFSIYFVAGVQAGTCELSASLINQDPYPAVPGSYVDVLFQIDGVGSNCDNGAVAELILDYPFSLDGMDNIQRISSDTYVGYNIESGWNLPYKVRVDAAALEGEYDIELGYKGGDQPSYTQKTFTLVVEDTRTIFDAVIQEVSGSDVSIAIANAGENVANSVVVRIPEQESFQASGTDGQMVGNLDAGDYTIVSFGLIPQIKRNFDGSSPQDTNNNLKFDIYYTDAIGERRIVTMELPVKMNTVTISSETGDVDFQGMRPRQQDSTNWTVPIVLVAVAVIVFFAYKKNPKKINKVIKNIFRKKNKSANKNSEKVPGWMNNSKK